MKDRLVSGGIAGAIAAIIQNLYGMLAKAVGLTDRTFAEFAATMVSQKVYMGVLGFIMGVVAHTIVGIMLGAIFAYLIKQSSSRYYLLKGFGFGIVSWFLLLSLGSIYNVPKFADIPPKAQLVTLLGAIIFGLVNAYVLKYIQGENVIKYR